MNIGDKLIQDIITSDNDDGIGNSLLNEICNGYPIENLSILFKANTIETSKSAIWILSELGRFENGYFDNYLNNLVNSENKFIRFYTFEYILAYSNNINLIDSVLCRLNTDIENLLVPLAHLLNNIKNDKIRFDLFKNTNFYKDEEDIFNNLFQSLKK